MRKLNPLDYNDPYSIRRSRSNIPAQLSHSCLNARKSLYKQHVYEPYFLPSQSSIRNGQTRSQTLYRFAPISESYASTSNRNLSCEVDPDEPQLPHYVVPVLYVPQRIITNEELLSSHIYDQFGQDCLNQESYSGRSNMSPCQSLSSQEDLYYQVSQDKATSTPRGSDADVHSRLTDSETVIYDRLMERLYGFRNRQAEKDFHHLHHHSKPADGISSDPINVEAEPDYENSPFNEGSDSDNVSSFPPSHSSKSNRLSASSFNQEYLVNDSRELSQYGILTSAYTVHPATSADFQRHRLLKDYKTSSAVISPKHRCTKKTRTQSPVASQTIVQEEIVFDTDLTIEREQFQSKCTQTATDASVTAQTGDHDDPKKSCKGQQMPEKGPVKRRTKGKGVKPANTDPTMANDKWLKTGTRTVLGENIGCSEVPEKTFKPVTPVPSVDLLPVESPSLVTVEEKMKFIPKLRTQSRFSCPSSVPLQH